ncbi:MAG: DUF5050 domain-containing protein [Lachnospiraceae bacterium]|nr:DUF5050 domain-containing protein [Lachnospiraceae bacterium]
MFSSKNEQFLHSMEPLFGSWYLEDTIGEGSSGTVYKITDKKESYCALKVIPVTLDDGINPLSFEKQDSLSKEAYLDEITNDILSEVKVMQTLERHEGIIKYQEYDILEMPDSYVRFILIKMELLNPLNKILRMRESEFSNQDTARIGIELLTSLSECRSYNIIHRDIKPSNIFVTNDNRYLLGDFGSARLLEKTMMASHKGTLAYMAPEMAAGQSFNATVDIYSLGLVLYQLLNNRRLPFLDSSFKFADIEISIEKRLSGVSFPYPENADQELGFIICKMCAYSPKDRYSSPEECLADLESYLKHGKIKRKTGKKLKAAIGGAFLLAILLTGIGIFSFNRNDEPVPCITSGNVNSTGAIASDDEWLYYSQDVPGQFGIRVSKQDGQKEVLCNYIMHCINVTKDAIVFASRQTPVQSDDKSSYTYITGLYKVNKDGSNFTCLDDSTVYNPIVYGKYVYYLRKNDDSNVLCRIPIEGGKTETLSTFNKFTFHFYLYKNELYIYDYGASQLVTFNLHTKEKTVIINDGILSNFCIEDGFLYCQRPGDTGFSDKLYIHPLNSFTPSAINLDNAETVTFPQQIYEFNVKNGIIYASSDIIVSQSGDASGDGIWRINRDGSDLKQIYTGNASQLQIVDQTLYFEDDLQTYKMDLDGSHLQEFNDITFFYGLY